MKTVVPRFVCVLALVVLCGHARKSATFADDAAPRFDVNDISYLWPVPDSAEAVESLISADDLLADGEGSIWSKAIFDKALAHAKTVELPGADPINFGSFDEEFVKRATWKVAAFRVDPSAPGSHPKLVAHFGQRPQVRLIMQPVTVNAQGKVKVHDYAAHLVFTYASTDASINPNNPRFGIPHRYKFSQILEDLNTLKSDLKASGVDTTGLLRVHPGFTSNVDGFPKAVADFVKKHVAENRLGSVAIMGIDPPEPWIFTALQNVDGELIPVKHPTLPALPPEQVRGTKQMLILRGGPPVVPTPQTTNLGDGKGVSTAVLFADDADQRLDDPVFDDADSPKQRDIPDIVANPQVAHFFNTDCVSCHTESARRSDLGLKDFESSFRYQLPPGIHGVDDAVLPRRNARFPVGWNVRNFGWFPDFFDGGKAVATATVRTSNEAAESADFINREYFGHLD